MLSVFQHDFQCDAQHPPSDCRQPRGDTGARLDRQAACQRGAGRQSCRPSGKPDPGHLCVRHMGHGRRPHDHFADPLLHFPVADRGLYEIRFPVAVWNPTK